jgi:hypothetical protein
MSIFTKNPPYLGLFIIALIVSLSFWGGCALSATLPDAKLTPGATRIVDVKTLCTTSTSLVRNVPSSEKEVVYSQYGLQANYTGYCKGSGGCEVDHLISLELGGSNDVKNLWPQPYFGPCNAHQKDALENKFHKLICGNNMSVQAAQLAISTNWIQAYSKYVDVKGCNF